MDTSSHSMESLFMQLGLGNDQAAISSFIDNHHLGSETPLLKATFWNNSQLQFIQEAWQQDSDWSEIVDQLDVMLRH